MTPESPEAKAFIKMLNNLDRSRRVYEKFRDVMELAYCAYAKPMAQSPEAAEALEARYMSIVNRYQDKDTIRAYPELLGMAIQAVQFGDCDFLGMVAGALEILDVRNGQFFTPYPVSCMMAEMCLDGFGDMIEQQGYLTIQEPACGAGGMVLACADVLQANGFDPSTQMLVKATDVSPMCYHMAYLQLTWRGIPALVEQANTLSGEQFDAAWTFPVLPFFDLHGRLFDRERKDDTQSVTIPDMRDFVQMSLFESEEP